MLYRGKANLFLYKVPIDDKPHCLTMTMIFSRLHSIRSSDPVLWHEIPWIMISGFSACLPVYLWVSRIIHLAPSASVCIRCSLPPSVTPSRLDLAPLSFNGD
jgi:hypothetical protein